MNPSAALPATLQGAVRLAEWGVIRAHGDDAARFLHSQLTQDIEGLDLGHARLAGFCSAKGRLQASFLVWRIAPSEFALACSADLLAATLKRLSMFVLRSKCKLEDASAQVELHGLVGSVATAWLGADAPATTLSLRRAGAATVLRLPTAHEQARYLHAAPGASVPPPLPALDIDGWNWLEVNSAMPRIVAATVDRFVPQMVNFELVGGVDFQKGCYPGQEVVARSQYRGTLKRRALLFECDSSATPGQEVFDAAERDQPAGMVVNAACRPGSATWSMLVEVKLTALSRSGLHLGGPAGPLLSLVALPYTLPSDTV